MGTISISNLQPSFAEYDIRPSRSFGPIGSGRPVTTPATSPSTTRALFLDYLQRHPSSADFSPDPHTASRPEPPIHSQESLRSVPPKRGVDDVDDADGASSATPPSRSVTPTPSMYRSKTLTIKHKQSGEPDVRSLSESGPASGDHGRGQEIVMRPDLPQLDFPRKQLAQTTKSTQDLTHPTRVTSKRKEDEGARQAGSSEEGTDEVQEKQVAITTEESKGKAIEQVHPVAAPTEKRAKGKGKEV